MTSPSLDLNLCDLKACTNKKQKAVVELKFGAHSQAFSERSVRNRERNSKKSDEELSRFSLKPAITFVITLTLVFKIYSVCFAVSAFIFIIYNFSSYFRYFSRSQLEASNSYQGTNHPITQLQKKRMRYSKQLIKNLNRFMCENGYHPFNSTV